MTLTEATGLPDSQRETRKQTQPHAHTATQGEGDRPFSSTILAVLCGLFCCSLCGRSCWKRAAVSASVLASFSCCACLRSPVAAVAALFCCGCRSSCSSCACFCAALGATLSCGCGSLSAPPSLAVLARFSCQELRVASAAISSCVHSGTCMWWQER